MNDTGGISDEVEVEVTAPAEVTALSEAFAELVDNDSDPMDLPFGHKPGEVKGPDPAEHPDAEG